MLSQASYSSEPWHSAVTLYVLPSIFDGLHYSYFLHTEQMEFSILQKKKKVQRKLINRLLLFIFIAFFPQKKSVITHYTALKTDFLKAL